MPTHSQPTVASAGARLPAMSFGHRLYRNPWAVPHRLRLIGGRVYTLTVASAFFAVWAGLCLWQFAYYLQVYEANKSIEYIDSHPLTTVRAAMPIAPEWLLGLGVGFAGLALVCVIAAMRVYNADRFKDHADRFTGGQVDELP